jgi:hypothetical protein
MFSTYIESVAAQYTSCLCIPSKPLLRVGAPATMGQGCFTDIKGFRQLEAGTVYHELIVPETFALR